jgi:hypothetical protein
LQPGPNADKSNADDSEANSWSDGWKGLAAKNGNNGHPAIGQQLGVLLAQNGGNAVRLLHLMFCN